VLKKSGMFEKKCPTWAGDFKLLADVIQVQNMRAKAWRDHLSTNANSPLASTATGSSQGWSQPAPFGLFGSETTTQRKLRLEKEARSVFTQLKTIQELVIKKKAEQNKSIAAKY